MNLVVMSEEEKPLANTDFTKVLNPMLCSRDLLENWLGPQVRKARKMP